MRILVCNEHYAHTGGAEVYVLDVMARLEARGAGPYSPVATNRTDTGRALNRRVELVERTTP